MPQPTLNIKNCIAFVADHIDKQGGVLTDHHRSRLQRTLENWPKPPTHNVIQLAESLRNMTPSYLTKKEA